MSQKNLTSRALLVSLRISQWAARKLDRQETAALARMHNTPSDAARVNKSLLPFAGDLERIHQKTGEVRQFYYKNTLPWGQEGVNIIKAEAYFEFTAAMREHKSAWLALVSDFVRAYPSLREDARSTLKSLYREEDYPSAGAVQEKFSFDVQFLPVPDASDWRVQLDDEAMESLRVQIEEQVKKSEGVAMRDAWDRCYKLVAHAHERLADPKNVFRDSLQENALELCQLLPQLNIADDPALEDMRRQIEGALCSTNVSTLRADPLVRSEAAAKLEEMMAKMGAMYGS